MQSLRTTPANKITQITTSALLATVLATIASSNLLYAQSVQFETSDNSSEEVTLRVGASMMVWGHRQALVWSEATGYFAIQSKDIFEGLESARKMPGQTTEIRGRWENEELFMLSSYSVLDQPFELPPAKAVEPWAVNERFGKLTFKGVVLHCIDRGYMLDLTVDVNGRRCGVLVQCSRIQPMLSLREVTAPGKTIEITGNLWSPYSQEDPDVPVVSCAANEIRPISHTPWPKLANTVEYENMLFTGRTSDGHYLLSRILTQPPVTVRLKLYGYQHVDWGLNDIVSTHFGYQQTRNQLMG